MITMEVLEKKLFDKSWNFKNRDNIRKRLNETTYELGKMAVDPEYQGLNIGQRLLEFAIEFAHSKKWKKIVLYSSTKLDAAMHIYRKFGFKGVALEKDLPYVRSDVKMELIL